MFYRRTLLLAMLKAFNGRVDKIRLQKLLFLHCNEQEKPSFHFIPYKFGCFSFQANADLLTLKKYGFVEDNEKEWQLINSEKYSGTLSSKDEMLLNRIHRRFSIMNSAELIHYTYTQYPFYAINSTILEKHLTEKEIANVRRAAYREETSTLFTIGYEGKTLEEFINILLIKNIPLLCDVRKNAFSMKYGFSKSTIANACANAGISYHHFPDLGIESAKRKNLETQEDYTALFKQYVETVLKNTLNLQYMVNQKIEKAGRAALMCFEADPMMCHRSHLATSLVSIFKNPLPLVHL